MAPITEDGGFGPLEYPEKPGGGNTALLVISPDRAGVTRALRRVEPRLYHVHSDGREVDVNDLDEDEADDVTSVSWVGGPSQHVRGVLVVVDFKGRDLTPEMARTFRAIVVDELRREAVEDASLAAPEERDYDTGGEALFASAGARSIALAPPEDGMAVVRALWHALPDDALLLADWRYEREPLWTFLREHGVDAGPLAFLGSEPALPLDAATLAGLWAAAEASNRNLQPVDLPAWFVSGDRVLAFVPASRGQSPRIRADTDPAVLAAFTSPPEPPAPRIAARESASDAAARRELADRTPRLQPRWWESGWRGWEPLLELPAEPEPFAAQETAARLVASVGWWERARRLPAFWEWRHAPFGPRIGAEEATAWMLALAGHRRVPCEAALAITRFVPGVLAPEQAFELQRRVRVLPAAAHLAVVVALAGPDATLEWVLTDRSARQVLHGVRAGLLPQLDAADLAERIPRAL